MDEFGKDSLKQVPSYASYPQGIFKSVQHYRRVLKAITKVLARPPVPHNSDPYGGDQPSSFLFDRLVVDFSDLYDAEEIFFDHFNSVVVIRAPKKKGEQAKALFQRRMAYLGCLSREFEAMRVIGITHVYLALSQPARQKIDVDK